MQESNIAPQYCCRWAPSLGDLEDSHEKVWGTKTYDPATDLDKPTVFFGMYGLADFLAFQRHRGQKWILWCGSDIRHLKAGYWLDTEGKVRIPSELIAPLLAKEENYTENLVEYNALLDLGIDSYIVPSFLGDPTSYPQAYQHSTTPKLYTSVSGDNFELYGWNMLPTLALKHPEVEFHLYGSNHEWCDYLQNNWPNLINHGRVPKEVMNAEIAQMQGAIRLTEFDGFSEILAKSVFMEQWPVSLIPYPHMLTLERIKDLAYLEYPNVGGREYYQEQVNKFPWNTRK